MRLLPATFWIGWFLTLNVFAGSVATPIPVPSGMGFGGSISISGKFAAIGVYRSEEAFDRSGSVQMFEYVPSRGGGAWVQFKTIVPDQPDDPVSGTYFGRVVRLSGDHLAVGSSEKVRLFHRNAGGPDQWGQIQTLEIANAAFLDLQLDGNRLLVKDYERRGDFDFLPFAKAFEWSETTQTWNLTVSTFGVNRGPLALNANTAVLGNPQPFGGFGEVWVVEMRPDGNWKETVVKLPGRLYFHSEFAASVALKGNWLAVGAPGMSDHPGSNVEEGRVYIYSRNHGGRNKWGHVATLKPVGRSAGFGCAVAMSGSKIAVSMEGVSKKVHVFERSGSTFRLKGRFLPKSPVSEGFGDALAIAGNRLLASGTWMDSTTTDRRSGVAFFSISAALPSFVTRERQLLFAETEATESGLETK